MVHADVRRTNAADRACCSSAWIAGSSPAMTNGESFSRHVHVPEPCRPRSPIDSPPALGGRRSAERRKPTIAARHQQTLPSAEASGAAARHFGGAPAFRRYAAALAGNCDIPDSAPGHASWFWNQAGVTRSIRSQFSGSTPRLGRSTEGNDAQSRSGADCESARKHRTRSTLQIASGMRPSMSEILSRNRNEDICQADVAEKATK